MIARKTPLAKDRGRRSSSRLGAVRLKAADECTTAGAAMPALAMRPHLEAHHTHL